MDILDISLLLPAKYPISTSHSIKFSSISVTHSQVPLQTPSSKSMFFNNMTTASSLNWRFWGSSELDTITFNTSNGGTKLSSRWASYASLLKFDLVLPGKHVTRSRLIVSASLLVVHKCQLWRDHHLDIHIHDEYQLVGHRGQTIGMYLYEVRCGVTKSTF